MVENDSTTNEQPGSTVEVTLKEFDELVEFKKAMDRLLDNPDWKLVVEQKYLQEDGQRLYDLLLSDNISLTRDRAPVLEQIVSKGWFKNWFKWHHFFCKLDT